MSSITSYESLQATEVANQFQEGYRQEKTSVGLPLKDVHLSCQPTQDLK